MSNQQTLVIHDPSPELFEILRILKDLQAKLNAVTMVPKPEWVTMADYAKHIGKSSRTIKRWIEAGQVEAKKVGQTWMIKL
jgi:hypothetical protein